MSLRAVLVTAFLILQGTDVVLTWLLLGTRGEVVEANPVANAVLASHGWSGVIALKAACTAVVLACVLAIDRTRPVLGRGLLAGLCALMLGVVGWSTSLLARPTRADPDEVAAALHAAALHRELVSLREAVRVRDRLCADLLGRRLDLVEAVRIMAERLEAESSRLGAPSRASLPDPSRPEQVARFLLARCDNAPARIARAPGAMASLREQWARFQASWSATAYLQSPERTKAAQ
ncbi:MAG: DUF5658 family protein [Gemmataceae bacterium]|nr:DUF5658 family protein [Gemmataceae bacterium]